MEESQRPLPGQSSQEGLHLLVLWDFLSSLNHLTYLRAVREVELGAALQRGSIRSAVGPDGCSSGADKGEMAGDGLVGSAGLTEVPCPGAGSSHPPGLPQ